MVWVSDAEVLGGSGMLSKGTFEAMVHQYFIQRISVVVQQGNTALVD